MNQFFRLVNPTFFRVTGKRVVDPQDRTDPIGVALSGVHFIDAFELVLDRHQLDFTESEGFFVVTEPVLAASTTDGATTSVIDSQAPLATPAVELPATAETREIRIDAVIFQLNSSRAREVGANWPALFGEAANATAGSGAGRRRRHRDRDGHRRRRPGRGGPSSSSTRAASSTPWTASSRPAPTASS